MDNTSPENGPHHNRATVCDRESLLLRETPPMSAPHRKRPPGFLRAVGTIVVVLGVALTVIGSISLFASWGTIGGSRYYWAAFLGLPLIAIGSAITQPEILGVHDVSLSREVNSVAIDPRTQNEAAVTCAHCEAANVSTANFCNQCGTLLKVRTCVGCGAKVTWNARFCTRCDKSLI
jgi:Double zinc ribbon